ncbi:hypothetical protein BGZ83_000173, partial [Gryganskiella cystojenkinii]
MKLIAFLANIVAILTVASVVDAAAITNCQVDKACLENQNSALPPRHDHFNALKGSKATDKVKSGAKFCFDLVGKADMTFPTGAVISIGLRDS